MTSRLLARGAIFAAVAAVPCLLVLAPIASFLLLSFFRLEDNQIVRDFTFANYAGFFGNATYWGTFLGTLWLCFEVMLFAVLIGYPVAWFVWKRRGRMRYFLLLLTVLPLFMSYIVKLYTLRSILGLNGLLNQALLGLGILERPSLLFLYNQRAVLLTMVVIYLPFAILPIFLTLERIPRNLLHASSDLGAGPGTTFRRVVLPLSLPGTIAGALFVFVLALGDFVTPQMVGGTSGFTFGRVIWSQFGLAYNWPFGAAMAGILLATALGVIALAGYAASLRRV
ncbi:MAG: ABC transporter permease [Parvibaculaceae bacterium]